MITPEWLRDLLTELSAIANGYTANVDSARRVLRAVPADHLVAAGLSPFGVVDEPEPPDMSHGIRAVGPFGADS